MSVTKIKSKDEPTLAENEAIIERGLEAYREAGLALKRIRNGRQYKPTHTAFEAYCQERWGFTRMRASQLINAAETAETVNKLFTVAPATEGVARELKGTPKQKVKILSKARTRHGNNPTAEQVRKVAEEENVVDIKSKRQQKPQKPKEGKRKSSDSQRTHGPSHDPAVIEWVWKKDDENWTREQVVAAAKAGTDGWPLPDAIQRNGEHQFSNGAWSECMAVIAHLKRVGMRPAPWPREPQAKVKLKVVEAEIKRVSEPHFEKHDDWRYTGIPIDTPEVGPRVDLLHMRRHLLSVTDLLETRDFSRLHIDSKAAMEMHQEIIYELESLLGWAGRIHGFLQARLDYSREVETIRHMRENTAGRPTAEIQTARKLADLKEGKLQPPPRQP